jgi:hypothetical protein
LDNLNDSEDINRAGENITEDIEASTKDSVSLYELKQHKPWFDKECSRFLAQRKQAKIQWLQDPNQSNVDDINNVRREINRYFRGKKKK